MKNNEVELKRLYWSTDRDKINHILSRLNPKYLIGLYKRCNREISKKEYTLRYLNSESFKEEILYNTPVEVKYDGCIFNVSLKTLFKEIGRRQEKDEMHWGNNGYGIPALFVVKKK
jgi:hypothetical protein